MKSPANNNFIIMIPYTHTINLDDYYSHKYEDDFDINYTLSFSGSGEIDYQQTDNIVVITGTSEGSITGSVIANVFDVTSTQQFTIDIPFPDIVIQDIPDFVGKHGFILNLNEYFDKETYDEIQYSVTGSHSENPVVYIEDDLLYVFGSEIEQFDVMVTATFRNFTPVTKTVNVNFIEEADFEINGASNVYDSGNYRYYEFTDTGETVAEVTGSTSVEVLMVGGGGAGGGSGASASIAVSGAGADPPLLHQRARPKRCAACCTPVCHAVCCPLLNCYFWVHSALGTDIAQVGWSVRTPTAFIREDHLEFGIGSASTVKYTPAPQKHSERSHLQSQS